MDLNLRQFLVLGSVWVGRKAVAGRGNGRYGLDQAGRMVRKVCACIRRVEGPLQKQQYMRIDRE